MDIRLLDTLRNAPSIDLYELTLLVNQLLADPVRILDIRRQLHLGAPVMFFDHRTNSLAPGHVTELRQKDLCVKDDRSNTQWVLPYAAVVVDPAQRTGPAAPPPRPVIRPDIFATGDTVTFTDKYFRGRIGTVTRINDKTVSLLCDGKRWRVSPRILRKMIDV